jgi:hypothetical protein
MDMGVDMVAMIKDKKNRLTPRLPSGYANDLAVSAFPLIPTTE